MAEVEKIKDIESTWGKKKAIGGKNKDTTFYESFTYDGVEYALYDCVYLYKHGESEPEIGKIMKLWDSTEKGKRVKLLWFFRPSEISYYLGAEEVLDKELFLASGQGKGLADINSVEAIAGKCNVLCISKDNENPQPSNEEIQQADFVFYRTFDVGQLKIMDKIEGPFGGVSVKFIYNRANIKKPGDNLNVDLAKNEVSGITTTSKETMVLSKQNSFKEHMSLDTTGNCVDTSTQAINEMNALLVEQNVSCVGKHTSTVGLNSMVMDKADERQQGASRLETSSSAKVQSKENEANLGKVLQQKLDIEVKGRTAEELDDLDSRPTKKAKLDTSKVSSDKRQINEKQCLEVEGKSTRNVTLDHVQDDKMKMDPSLSTNVLTDQSEKSEQKSKIIGNGIHMKGLSSINPGVDDGCKLKVEKHTHETNIDPNKKRDGNAKVLSNVKLSIASHQETQNKSQKALSSSGSPIGDRCKRKDVGESFVPADSNKKLKVGDKTSNLSIAKLPKAPPRPPKAPPRLDVPDAKNNSNVTASSPISSGVNSPLGREKDPLKKMNPDAKSPKLSNRELPEKSLTQPQHKSKKLGQVMEVSQYPKHDRRKWFKEVPWQDMMETAHEQGTLVLLQNLYPAYTSADVEDIVCKAFGEYCTAKMVQQTASSSPYSGQALVIFKTREAAKKVIGKLDESCLLLSNGRPLVGSIATNSYSTRKKPIFFGHLVLPKKHSMLYDREMREAVSSPHFSQPNTIEYDMSMEWCALQDKSDIVWKNLYKQQWKEVRELKAGLKSK